MHTFYLVRHAHTNWTAEESRPLSSKGMRDARRVAEILEEHPITIVYSSPYTRACQTIEPLVVKRGLGICMDERLRERELGQYQSISFEEAVRCTWQDMDYAFPGGETNRQAQRRAIQWMQELMNHERIGHVLVATHGNLLALLLKQFDPAIGFEFWRRLSMPDIYKLEILAGGEARYERLWDRNRR
jgi:2,3-bisphosphoglycerate-dependent phosphoglycerate mutase